VPHDLHLAERMRLALSKRKGIEERKMFGGFCWMLHGNMLCGVEVGRYMFRVGKDLEMEALLRPGATPMDITGRPMRGFVWVLESSAAGRQLESWIDLAARYVSELPPKKRKAPAAAKRHRIGKGYRAGACQLGLAQLIPRVFPA
jgi:TfoX/Sxy family transcriptional regulator of competence genes